MNNSFWLNAGFTLEPRVMIKEKQQMCAVCVRKGGMEDFFQHAL